MRFLYASSEDEMPESARFHHAEGSDVLIAEEDGETLGSVVFTEKEDYGVLEHVEVYSDSRGRGIGSELVERVFEQSEKENLYAQASAMSGKIQRMLQNRGFEASGMRAGNQVSEPQVNASEGFNLNLWKLDEEVKAYIPEELREFTEASLESQREVEYLEPEPKHQTGSFDIIRSELTGKTQNTSKKTNRLHIKIGEGNTLKKSISEAIDALEPGDYWAKTVEMDTTQPITHDIARTLHQKGFKPVDFSPSIEGQDLTMLDLGAEAGIYGVTDETLELIDSTGLDYTIEGSDDQTTQIAFQP